MTMPTWDQTLHPILHELADGRLKDARSIRAAVIAAFAMTVDEQNEMLKSGQPRIANRVGWGLTDLHKAQLVEKGDKRGTYRITDAGREFLQRHEDAITLADLETVPAFLAWRQGYQSKTVGAKERSTASQADISEQSDEALPRI